MIVETTKEDRSPADLPATIGVGVKIGPDLDQLVRESAADEEVAAPPLDEAALVDARDVAERIDGHVEQAAWIHARDGA